MRVIRQSPKAGPTPIAASREGPATPNGYLPTSLNIDASICASPTASYQIAGLRLLAVGASFSASASCLELTSYRLADGEL